MGGGRERGTHLHTCPEKPAKMPKCNPQTHPFVFSTHSRLHDCPRRTALRPAPARTARPTAPHPPALPLPSSVPVQRGRGETCGSGFSQDKCYPRSRIKQLSGKPIHLRTTTRRFAHECSVRLRMQPMICRGDGITSQRRRLSQGKKINNNKNK